jgi:integrase
VTAVAFTSEHVRRSDYDPFARTLRFKEKGGKVIVKPVADPLADVLDAAIFAGVYNDQEVLDAPGGQALCDSGGSRSGSGERASHEGRGAYGAMDAAARVARTGGIHAAVDHDPYLIPGNAVQRRPGDRDDRVVWRLIRKVAERAGVKTTVHALRAAFAVAYLEQMGTEHLFSLQQLMGHSRPETTNLYLRRLDRRRSMETVRGLNWGVESSESLESNALAEKEGFEPSFPSKSHGNRPGFPSEHPDHG